MNDKNLKECPLEKQVEIISHWANLKHINPLSHFQLLNQRVFFWIFNRKVRAALTVEAAFVIPIFILALCTMMSILDCYRIQSIVKISLYQSAMELGMYAYNTDADVEGVSVINSTVCTAYAQARLPQMEDHVSVSMKGSCYEDNKVCLIATITYKFPISLFPLPPLKMKNISEVYSWVGESHNAGDKLEAVAEEMVYITENRSVYHTDASCSHIDIEIYETREKNAKKEYEPCQKCCEGKSLGTNTVVYYTKTGERYHLQKDCSSLTRIVRMIEFSQVQDLPICERCEKEE